MAITKGTRSYLLAGLALLSAAIWLAACGERPSRASLYDVPGGDPERGILALREYGCISCHTIPGVRGADAVVGPPLIWWADRHFIAGRVANTPENLIRFIQSPDSISPGTAMPDMGVSRSAAEDISAYLYTLRRQDWWPATR